MKKSVIEYCLSKRVVIAILIIGFFTLSFSNYLGAIITFLIGWLGLGQWKKALLMKRKLDAIDNCNKYCSDYQQAIEGCYHAIYSKSYTHMISGIEIKELEHYLTRVKVCYSSLYSTLKIIIKLQGMKFDMEKLERKHQSFCNACHLLLENPDAAKLGAKIPEKNFSNISLDIVKVMALLNEEAVKIMNSTS